MAEAPWKSSLSASDRFQQIQALRLSLPDISMSNAVALEQAAYNDSLTLDQYQSTLAAAVSNSTPPLQDTSSSQHDPDSGIQIGSYQSCTYIADGVTSEVYRSANKALKVIITTNIEPHNPQREVKILQTLHPPCIPLLEVFRDQHQRQVLVFPYMPLTLASLLDQGPLSNEQIQSIFSDTLNALISIHSQGIIHRDIKPSAILLSSPAGPAHLSDFGTAWHPEFSAYSEPPSQKILDIGTGPYRAPETLFVDRAYGTGVDMWGFGVMLAEAISNPPKPPFESRAAHEDGNQLGLILSIFKTLGTPTPETWPEAKNFKVTPFELWTVFPQRTWDTILPHVDPEFRDAVAVIVTYSGRSTAEELSSFKCFISNASS